MRAGFSADGDEMAKHRVPEGYQLAGPPPMGQSYYPLPQGGGLKGDDMARIQRVVIDTGSSSDYGDVLANSSSDLTRSGSGSITTSSHGNGTEYRGQWSTNDRDIAFQMAGMNGKRGDIPIVWVAGGAAAYWLGGAIVSLAGLAVIIVALGYWVLNKRGPAQR